MCVCAGWQTKQQSFFVESLPESLATHWRPLKLSVFPEITRSRCDMGLKRNTSSRVTRIFSRNFTWGFAGKVPGKISGATFVYINIQPRRKIWEKCPDMLYCMSESSLNEVERTGLNQNLNHAICGFSISYRGCTYWTTQTTSDTKRHTDRQVENHRAWEDCDKRSVWRCVMRRDVTVPLGLVNEEHWKVIVFGLSLPGFSLDHTTGLGRALALWWVPSAAGGRKRSVIKFFESEESQKKIQMFWICQWNWLYLLTFLTLYSSITLWEVCRCVQGRKRYRNRKPLAVAAAMSAQFMAWHGWCKMWCLLASAVAKPPTRSAWRTVNQVNNPDPRDNTTACGKGVKYTHVAQRGEHIGCERRWRRR